MILLEHYREISKKIETNSKVLELINSENPGTYKLGIDVFIKNHKKELSEKSLKVEYNGFEQQNFCNFYAKPSKVIADDYKLKPKNSSIDDFYVLDIGIRHAFELKINIKSFCIMTVDLSTGNIELNIDNNKVIINGLEK